MTPNLKLTCKLLAGSAASIDYRRRTQVTTTLPAISMWQPFASLLFTWDRERGNMVKCFETRSFRLPARLIGQPVAIHATAKFPASRHISEGLNDLCYQLWGCGYNFGLPFGAVLGTVRFGAPVLTGEAAAFQPDSEIAAGDWTPGRWAWPVIEADALISPVPMKGKQGWWRFPQDAPAPSGEPSPQPTPTHQEPAK